MPRESLSRSSLLGLSRSAQSCYQRTSSTSVAAEPEMCKPTQLSAVSRWVGRLETADFLLPEWQWSQRMIWAGCGQESSAEPTDDLILVLPELFSHETHIMALVKSWSQKIHAHALLWRYPGHGLKSLCQAAAECLRSEDYQQETNRQWLLWYIDVWRLMGKRMIIISEGKGLWWAQYVILQAQSLKLTTDEGASFVSQLHAIKPALYDVLSPYHEPHTALAWRCLIWWAAQRKRGFAICSWAQQMLFKSHLFHGTTSLKDKPFSMQEFIGCCQWLLHEHKLQATSICTLDAVKLYQLDSKISKAKKATESWVGAIATEEVTIMRFDDAALSERGLGFFQQVEAVLCDPGHKQKMMDSQLLSARGRFDVVLGKIG